MVVVAAEAIGGGEPVGRDGRRLLERAVGEREERGAARRHEPLVGGAGDGVEPGAIDGKPAGRLRRVHDRERPVNGGCGGDAFEIGDRAVSGLHGAEGDDVGLGVDGVGKPVKRRRPDVEALPLHEKRPLERREIDLWHEHRRAVGNACGNEGDEVREARARRHTLGGHADELSEELARAVGRVAPVLPARPSMPPFGERLLERVERGGGRETERRGVEVRPLRLPQAPHFVDRRHAPNQTP